ncbi:hypothetical protein EUX98_g8965 [Antrodiella citrinella]|uniref:Major facilitator superfamily (MFS) profile domain-containing protein n=1 Tax=Antrodiella citrinella TaxID=2447956 RepID=A0A4S4M6E5_9APHY|nr:hypothetical protein EUX98_g8965 [Antrodiella citrinella]
MAASELEPLLPQPHPQREVTPLPKVKLAVVFAIKLLIPVASSQPSPYINRMLGDMLGSSEKVGYYSGLVASSFHLAQMLGMYPWARISDKIGRRPVIFLGSVGIAVFTALFGFVDSIWGIVVVRFILGWFCGTTGAIHAIVGELTDETNQSTAFPLYDIVAAVGLMVGPLIGGTFVDFASKSADSIPHDGVRSIFERNPYLLPNIVTTVLALLICGLAFGVLDETLPAHRLKPPTQITPASTSSDLLPAADDEEPKDDETLSAWHLLTIPVVRSICVSTFILGFLAAGFNVGVVLVAYTDVRNGGLSLSPQQIGFALSIMGGLSIFLKLSLTWILRPDPNSGQSVSDKLTSLFTKTMGTWPVTFVGFIVLAWVSRGNGEVLNGLMWFTLSVVMFLSRIGCIPFTLIMLLVKENTPTPASLGTLNGLTELVQAISIVISPPLVGSLFALSISHHVLGGYLWVAFYVFSSVVGAIIAIRLERQQHVRVEPRAVEA